MQYLNQSLDHSTLAFAGLTLTFLATCYLLHQFGDKLPRDQGRDYAFGGKQSAGKPRGAGFIFILVFVAAAVIFGKWSRENFIYFILLVAGMMTGFLDDCSKSPWNEYKKGLLDLIIAFMISITYLNFNGNQIELAFIHKSIIISPVLFVVLEMILVWVSINVTNCSDGVDGLSGTLTIITLATIYVVGRIKKEDPQFTYFILLFIICILAYLWYNATPSKMMMGDAGSRAMGVFIAICILKTGSPFLYIPVAFVLIMNGGLGLIKVSLLRFLKIDAMKHIRTPLHDQVRKVWNWSNTQTVFRFAIIQIMIGVAVVYLIQ